MAALSSCQRTRTRLAGKAVHRSAIPETCANNFVIDREVEILVGQGSMTAPNMDSLFSSKPPVSMQSVGASLNVGVNELADVFYMCFLNVVEEED